jgi:hypothetical protein
LVADEGHHSRETPKSLDDGPWKSRIAGPQRDGFLRRHGDAAARRAVLITPTGGLLLLPIVAADDRIASLALGFEPDLPG